MLDILKMLPKSLIKSGFEHFDVKDKKSTKYIYMTLICMFIYSLNKYNKKSSNKYSSYCNSCGSPNKNCSCSRCNSCGSHSRNCSCSKCNSCGSKSSDCSCSSSNNCSDSSYSPCPPRPPCPPCPPSSSSDSCSYDTSCTSSDSCSTSNSCSSSNSCSDNSCGECNNCKVNCGDPYPLCTEKICKNYSNCQCATPCFTSILVNENQLCIPQFNLRTLPGCINFFYNFYVANLSLSSINSLIMLKDLLTWRSGGGISIGSDILPDCIYPVYFIYKDKNCNICCYEYLRIFINTDDCNTRTAFVSKGKDYLCVVDKINFLLVGCDDCPFINDLLNGSEYYTYNISESCPQTLYGFIIALLSLYLIPNCLIGKQIIYDISHCNETQKQLEYFYEYFNCDCNPVTNM